MIDPLARAFSVFSVQKNQKLTMKIMKRMKNFGGWWSRSNGD